MLFKIHASLCLVWRHRITQPFVLLFLCRQWIHHASTGQLTISNQMTRCLHAADQDVPGTFGQMGRFRFGEWIDFSRNIVWPLWWEHKFQRKARTQCHLSTKFRFMHLNPPIPLFTGCFLHVSLMIEVHCWWCYLAVMMRPRTLRWMRPQTKFASPAP